MRLDYNPTERNKFFFTFSHVNEGPRDLVRDFENVLNSEIGPRFRNIRRATFGYTRFLTPAMSFEFLASAQRDPRVIEPCTTTSTSPRNSASSEKSELRSRGSS
jgi:hypothetical protein